MAHSLTLFYNLGCNKLSSASLSLSLTHTHTHTQPTRHPKPPTLPKISGVHTKKELPSFSFSRSELITLARFDDSETAEEVLDWLGEHGILN